MTVIIIEENIKIKTHFKTFFDLFKHIEKELKIELTPLENQNNILNSSEYNEYNNILKSINV